MYRAEQRGLGREAVVKVLRARPDEDAVRRFLREAQLASRLDHPYAAHVYAFGGLRLETVRRLDADQLARIAGGYVSIPCNTRGCTINYPTQVTCGCGPSYTTECPV